jgi:hypothetical protein
MGILTFSILAAQPLGSQKSGKPLPQPTHVPSRELVLKTFVDGEDLRKNGKSRLEAVREQIKHRLEVERPDNPELLKIVDDIFGEMIDNLPIDDLIEAMVRFAQRHFTEADLQVMATFHATPAGHNIDAKLKGIAPIVARTSDPEQERILAATPLPQNAPSERDVERLLDVMQARTAASVMARAFQQRFSRQEAEDTKSLEHGVRVMALIYRHYFTADEVQAMIAFFSSATGQKLVAGAPDLSAEVAKVMEPSVHKATETLRDRVAEYDRQRAAGKGPTIVKDIEEARKLLGSRGELYRLSAGTPDEDGWYEAESTRGHFRVKLPAPFNDFRVPEHEHSAVVELNSVGTSGKPGSKWSASLITYTDAETAKSFFGKAWTGSGRATPVQSFMFKGLPAREIWISDTPRSLALRQVLVGREQYLLMVEYDTTQDLRAEIVKFMNSLEFPPPAAANAQSDPSKQE